ncbi:MAG: hypothetical protein ACFFBP_16380 [Promethearchaeota archaeon]
MTENLDLKKIEKKTWRSFFEDGIFEIYLGLLHIGVGIAWSFIDVAPFSVFNLFGIILIVFGFLFFILGKKFITIPRVGKIKFGRKRKVRKMKTVIILSVNVILLLIIYLFGLLSPPEYLIFPSWFNSLIIGFLFTGVPMSIVAYFLDFPRLYIIAFQWSITIFLLDMFSLILSEPFNIIITFAINGSIMVCMGLYFFIKFLIKYPSPKKEGE